MPAPPPAGDPFPSTIWSQIRVGPDREQRARAFESLARRYERPIRAWLRAMGARDDEEARDRTQDFFLWVMESGFLEKADPRLGRFRAFLKTALRHHFTDRHRAETAGKRGGGRTPLSLDAGGEGAGMPEPADPRSKTPEVLLDEAWRETLLSTAVQRLRERMEASGRARAFAVFRDFYLEPVEGSSYESLAATHGLDRVGVSNALARTKKAYRAELARLVQDSVQSAEEYEQELRWLFGPGRTPSRRGPGG